MATSGIDRINDLFNNKKARKTFLKLRFPLLLVLFILLLTQLKRPWFIPGLAVSLLGELMQLWCFATIKTKKQLTTTGPYMFVRNPMYIGRFFLILGIIMMTGNPWLMSIYAVVYYFYMVNRVRREERLLQDIFGQPYADYCREVNRYIPTFIGFEADRLLQFDKESFRQNHGIRNAALVSVCYVILFIFTFIYPI